MADLSTVHIGVGSNIDPKTNVPEAIKRLGRVIRLTASSTFYRTRPVGDRRQPDFRNGVVKATTDLEPRALKFGVLRVVEQALGRQRTADRYARRTIDLDLLLCGRVVIEEPDLRIPDPDIRTRPFLAVPLLELDPNLVLPDNGQALSDLPAAHNRAGLEVDPWLTEAVRSVLTGEEARRNP